jgi:hypothetical protein
VKQQLDSGIDIQDVNYLLNHDTRSGWLICFFTTDKGKQVILKGWKKAGVTGVVDGTITIPSEDPFYSI